MYEQLNLRDWPFRVIPDKEFGVIWAGRRSTKAQLERLLKKTGLAPKSSLHLMWANFGMGKTHTLYHIEHLCRTRFRQIIPIYAVLPKQGKGFLDLYRAIAAALPLDLLGERLRSVSSSTFPDDVCLHPLFADNPDVANAVLATLSQDVTKVVAAKQWLFAQTGLPRKSLDQIGVTRTIRSPEDATSALTILVKLLTWNSKPPKKALIMFDEFQRIGELTPKLRREINVGLHTFYNANPTGLGLILSFSFGRQADVKYMLSEELRSRAELQTISLDTLSSDEAVEFVHDLLAQFHIEQTSDYTPFTRGAVDEIIQYTAQNLALTPRNLMHCFNHVLQEWMLDHEDDGKVQLEQVLNYLSLLDVTAMGSDVPDV